MQGIEGKVAVITGGSRGLGLAMARGLAAAGAAVVVASRAPVAVDAAVRELRGQNFRAAGLAVDVAKLDQVEELADLALQEFGRLDIWINNAGTAGPYGPTVEITPQSFNQVVLTNILGVYNGSRTAVRHFLGQRSGKLINILGRGWQGPVPWQNAYASTKAWVRSFTMALAEETRQSGIGIYAYNPGMVLTELLTNVEVIQGHEEKLKNFERVVRVLAKSPEEAARGAVRLASAETDGKTGLVSSNFSPAAAALGFLQEGLRDLFKRPATKLDLRLTSIPPAER